MAPAKKTDNTPRCSFCGKSQDEGAFLIAGASAFICDGCVGICNELIAA